MLVLRNVDENMLDFDNAEIMNNRDTIPVNLYHVKDNIMEQIGAVERNIETIEKFIEAIPPENVRII